MASDGHGLNDSEKYLSQLCERSFLSLWCYTNVFRQPGHELCDVLVVVGNDIIIFSDKACQFPNTGDIKLDWGRWFRKAVIKSAAQLWGAENWIRRHPERAFLDDKCRSRLPIPMSPDEHTRFHLVLVAHGASKACKSMHGGSGSLMFHSNIVGFTNHTLPFAIGDLDRDKSFVHVLDDYTLDLLLNNRDTITDFTSYLRHREEFLRGEIYVFSSGEEELLTLYMNGLIDHAKGGFTIPDTADGEPFRTIMLKEGCWEEFQDTVGRKRQLEENEISYIWDIIIERLSQHAKAGTHHYVSEGGFADSELAIRMMALQTRFERRVLSLTLQEMILTTTDYHVRLRVVPMGRNNVYFALALYPREAFDNYEEYRAARRAYIQAVCLVVMKEYPTASCIVGLATETGITTTGRTEDLMLFDRADWNNECLKIAQKAQIEFDILTHAKELPISIKEYPEE